MCKHHGQHFCCMYLVMSMTVSMTCLAQDLDCPPSQPELVITANPTSRILNQEEQQLPSEIQALLIAYSDSIKSASKHTETQGSLVFKNNTKHAWERPKQKYDLFTWSKLSKVEQAQIWKQQGFKDFDHALNHARLAEQFLQLYPHTSQLPKDLPVNFEPGRLRDEVFFKKLYGRSKAEVAQHLTTVDWGKQKLKVTRLHKIDQRLQAIYTDLKNCLPKKFKRYYEPSAGAFTWRKIKGTQRLSVHSFGAAIDIGVKYSNYWKWTMKVYGRNTQGLIPYKNSFPVEIVETFKRYGFIWGGWWYHHDTMHFEYRPELIIDKQ